MEQHFIQIDLTKQLLLNCTNRQQEKQARKILKYLKKLERKMYLGG